MSNVINGNFGVPKDDIELLAAVYEYAGLSCESDEPVSDRFNLLSRHTLLQEKAIRFAYEAMSNHLMALCQNFYQNGETDKDLKLMTDFREKVQDLEQMIRDMTK